MIQRLMKIRHQGKRRLAQLRSFCTLLAKPYDLPSHHRWQGCRSPQHELSPLLQDLVPVRVQVRSPRTRSRLLYNSGTDIVSMERRGAECRLLCQSPLLATAFSETIATMPSHPALVGIVWRAAWRLSSALCYAYFCL